MGGKIPVMHCPECGISIRAARREHCARRLASFKICEKAMLVQRMGMIPALNVWIPACLEEKKATDQMLMNIEEKAYAKVRAGTFKITQLQFNRPKPQHLRTKRTGNPNIRELGRKNHGNRYL